MKYPNLEEQTGMILDGIAASEAIDGSGEQFSVKGADLSDFYDGKGLLNFEHKGDSANDLVGTVIYAKKIYAKKDCEDARQEKYWNSVELPFVYIVGRLFDKAGHPGAIAIAAQFRDQNKLKERQTLRLSIEGATLARDGQKLTSTICRRVAITATPCNHSAITGLISDPMAPDGYDKQSKKVDKDFLSEIAEKNERNPGMMRLGQGPELSDFIISSDLVKTTTAGSYDAAPSSLTGGSALQVEDLGQHGRAEKLKQLTANAKAAFRDWKGDRTKDFRKFMKHRLPDASEEFLNHFEGLVEEHKLNLKKGESEDLEKGSLQAKHPYSALTDTSGTERRTIENWQNYATYGDRNKVPRLKGEGRFRALHRLHSKTQARRNPETGEREFLLHRGVGKHDDKNKILSWTADKKIAESFASTRPGTELRSEWIPEGRIHHVLDQVGNINDSTYIGHQSIPGRLHVSADGSMRKIGKPGYKETEVLVANSSYVPKKRTKKIADPQVMKFERLAVTLYTLNEQLKKAEQQSTTPEVEYQGKKVKPGTLDHKGEDWAVLGQDQTHYHAVPSPKISGWQASDIKKFPKAKLGHDFNVSELPHYTGADRKLKATEHGDPINNKTPIQHELVEGLDLDSKEISGKKEKDAAGFRTNSSRWLNHPKHGPVYVKTDELDSPDYDQVYFSSPKKEVVYHNLLNSFFGAGKHTTPTAFATDPQNGRDIAIVKGVDQGHHYNQTDSGHHKTLKKMGDSGELDKLAMANYVLGNADRHHGNMMFDGEDNLKLIDSGEAFGVEPMLIDRNFDIPAYLAAYRKSNKLAPEDFPESNLEDHKWHPDAVKWAKGLNKHELEKQMEEQGVPPLHQKAVMDRFNWLQRTKLNQKGGAK